MRVRYVDHSFCQSRGRSFDISIIGLNAKEVTNAAIERKKTEIRGGNCESRDKFHPRNKIFTPYVKSVTTCSPEDYILIIFKMVDLSLSLIIFNKLYSLDLTPVVLKIYVSFMLLLISKIHKCIYSHLTPLLFIILKKLDKKITIKSFAGIFFLSR